MRVIALGSAMRGDDGFMLALAERMFAGDPSVALVLAGRPGAGLLDLLDTDDRVLLLDVVVSGRAPGTLHHFTLAELPEHAKALAQLSSHGFGPAEALELARALGRRLPEGEFLGIEGGRFELGGEVSPELVASSADLEARVREIVGSVAA
ncbi:hydrogenase maturation protease [Nannocystaceae bacterium ST9]